jgi:transcription elongation GreA/GreB family factor
VAWIGTPQIAGTTPSEGLAQGADRGDRTPSDRRRIGVGSRVRVFDGYGEVEFVIVPDDARAESDLQVSLKSPLGKALLGRGVGEEVMVRSRTGIHFVRIREVL